MKIAILAEHIDNGIFHGQFTYAFNLISGLSKKNIDHTLFYTDIPESTNYPDSKKLSYRLYRLPLINEYVKNRLINLKASNYDILHVLTNCGLPNGRSRVKKVVTIHDLIPFKNTEFYTEYTLSYILRGIKGAIKAADAVIAISEFTKNDIVEIFNYDRSKVYVVYNGIDHNLLSTKNVPRLVPEEYILHVGGLTPRKGLSYLLEAFSKLKDQLPHKLVLIDSMGWRDTKIYKVINEYKLNGRVLLKKADTIEEMANYYSYADVFVYPSLYEGFGYPPLEAMICGCPVITSNNTSLKELYERVAVLVDPLNTEELAERIFEVINNSNLRNKLAEKGLALSKNFTQEKMVEDTIKVYEKILKI